jgi:hypothetical protein
VRGGQKLANVKAIYELRPLHGPTVLSLIAAPKVGVDSSISAFEGVKPVTSSQAEI